LSFFARLLKFPNVWNQARIAFSIVRSLNHHCYLVVETEVASCGGAYYLRTITGVISHFSLRRHWEFSNPVWDCF
jgi:hypothetical protein